MSYWDIQDFLSEQQSLQFCFLSDVEGMQFIDPSKDLEGIIPAQQRLNAPLWILYTAFDYLCADDHTELIRVDLPDQLTSKDFENRVEAFRASQYKNIQLINFDKCSNYYYQIYLGLDKITQGCKDKYDGKKVALWLEQRGKVIISRGMLATDNYSEHGTLKNYTKFQMSLYKSVQNIIKNYDNWKYKHTPTYQ